MIKIVKLTSVYKKIKKKKETMKVVHYDLRKQPFSIQIEIFKSRKLIQIRVDQTWFYPLWGKRSVKNKCKTETFLFWISNTIFPPFLY